MPVTMVRKITGAMIILTSLMKPSPSGFIASPVCRREMAEQDAGDDRDQHLDVELAIPGTWAAGGLAGWRWTAIGR